MQSWSINCRYLLLIVALLTPMQFSPSATAQEEVPTARKLDEFEGHFSTCDYGARLDNLAIEIQNNPDTDAYIICYGPDVNGSGSVSRRLAATTDYLVNVRQLDGSRVKTLYGGRYKNFKQVFTELWIVPTGASLPEPVSFENNAKTFTGMFDEYEYWEGTEEGESLMGNLTLASFTDVLRQQSDTRAYIVVRIAKEGVPGAWRRAVKEVFDSVQGGYGIEAERIKVIRAGYDAKIDDESPNATVQLWILPRDAPPPAVEVKGPEPTPEKAIRWRSFGVYELEDEADKNDVFEAFSDVLRSNKELSVCIVVHQQDAPPATAEQDVEADKQVNESGSGVELTPDSDFKLPDVDLMGVAGQWQSDLATKHGISRQRLTIISGQSEDWSYGMMEIWIVPTGAALPDPNGDNVVETDDDSDQAPVQEETPEGESNNLRP